MMALGESSAQITEVNISGAEHARLLWLQAEAGTRHATANTDIKMESLSSHVISQVVKMFYPDRHQPVAVITRHFTGPVHVKCIQEAWFPLRLYTELCNFHFKITARTRVACKVGAKYRKNLNSRFLHLILRHNAPKLIIQGAAHLSIILISFCQL